MSNYTAFQKVYWREVMAETSGMTAMEFGAYVALCAAYWSNGKPLAKDEARLARTARCTDAEWASIRRVVLEFFRLEDGAFRHDKLDAALEEARLAHEKRVNSGRVGGETRVSNAQAMLKPRSSNAQATRTRTRTRTRTNNNHPTGDTPMPVGFDEFWAAYGKKGDKPKSILAYEAALKQPGVTPSEIIAGAKRYRAFKMKAPDGMKFYMDAERWLSGSKWEDQTLPQLAPVDTRYNPAPHIPLPVVRWND